MYKTKLFMILALGLIVTFSGFTGCSSKKKVVAQPKQEVKAPAEKPPAPKVQEPPIVAEKIIEKAPEVPRDLSFTTIYFDFDKSNIRDDQRPNITKNARLLSQYQTVRIRIEGHCDERGTNEYNLALGQRRADSVKSFLSDYDINDSRISTVSYGESRPVDPGHNEVAWAKNRRGEFIIVGSLGI